MSVDMKANAFLLLHRFTLLLELLFLSAISYFERMNGELQLDTFFSSSSSYSPSSLRHSFGQWFGIKFCKRKGSVEFSQSLLRLKKSLLLPSALLLLLLWLLEDFSWISHMISHWSVVCVAFKSQFNDLQWTIFRHHLSLDTNHSPSFTSQRNISRNVLPPTAGHIT